MIAQSKELKLIFARAFFAELEKFVKIYDDSKGIKEWDICGGLEFGIQSGFNHNKFVINLGERYHFGGTLALRIRKYRIDFQFAITIPYNALQCISIAIIAGFDAVGRQFYKARNGDFVGLGLEKAYNLFENGNDIIAFCGDELRFVKD